MTMDGNGADRSASSKQVSSLLPAVKFGALSGAFGLIYGGVSGVLRTKHPVVRSLSAAVYFSALGTSFWWLRSTILREQFRDNASRNQRTVASAVAGGLAGGGVSLAVNRRFVPGLVVFSLVGGAGQLSYNAVDDWHTRQQDRTESTKSWAERIAESRWVPVRSLSDEEYKEMLGEKLLRVETEIALIDDRIQSLREVEESDEKSGSS